MWLGWIAFAWMTWQTAMSLYAALYGPAANRGENRIFAIVGAALMGVAFVIARLYDGGGRDVYFACILPLAIAVGTSLPILKARSGPIENRKANRAFAVVGAALVVAALVVALGTVRG